MTRPYAEVIGDPISHSKSPTIHGFWLEKLGIDAEYRRCHVRPEELADYVASRREDANWRGCNVTIPHKEAMSRLVDRRDARASAIGAVNTVTPTPGGGLAGMNTDPEGVAEAVAGIDLAGRVAVVVKRPRASRVAST